MRMRTTKTFCVSNFHYTLIPCLLHLVLFLSNLPDGLPSVYSAVLALPLPYLHFGTQFQTSLSLLTLRPKEVSLQEVRSWARTNSQPSDSSSSFQSPQLVFSCHPPSQAPPRRQQPDPCPRLLLS
ncbi:hypothetical protein L211DRAFT_40607 [Terfezia boudieri ATCC MYA-4762]|uniref:Uncharacterized protein n=1 Tax=Terfezia boudieri ATCC MYA-4762 TaxID=1051890 RepID=A0A3N4MQC8_9PEZI|nr:hypothetical protein L211DRAFT_40607 [Terfezia boudieri ATCC MYA-4762]